MNELYLRIADLCKARGITPWRMCMDLGLHQNTISDLKTGKKKSLTAPKLHAVAEYLGVSVDFLLGETEETDELIDAIKNDKNMRALFMVAKDCSPADIRQAIKIIEALKND